MRRECERASERTLLLSVQNTFNSHQFDCNWVIFGLEVRQKQKLRANVQCEAEKTNEEINSPSMVVIFVFEVV